MPLKSLKAAIFVAQTGSFLDKVSSLDHAEQAQRLTEKTNRRRAKPATDKTSLKRRAVELAMMTIVGDESEAAAQPTPPATPDSALVTGIAKVIMHRADRHDMNGLLSIQEMRTFLRGTAYMSFGVWLTSVDPASKERRFRRYDEDSDGKMDLPELVNAVGEWIKTAPAALHTSLESGELVTELPQQRKREVTSHHQGSVPTKTSEAGNEMVRMLSTLQSKFLVGGRDGAGSLQVDEFIHACSNEGLGQIFQTCEADDLFEMFQKIDVNNDGNMEWREFINFLLYSNIAQLSIHENDHSQEYLYQPIPSLVFNRRNTVKQIKKLMYDEKNDVFISCSLEGSFKVWNSQNMAYRQTVPVTTFALTDICASSVLTMVVSSAINGQIFFTRSDNLTLPPQHYETIDTVPMCVTTWNEGVQQSTPWVAVGDDHGQIWIWCYFEGSDNMKNRQSYRYSVHDGWVTQLRFIHSLQCLLSSSTDSTIVLYDLENKCIRETYNAHNQAVNAFAHSSAIRTVFSVGTERAVYVWDIYRCATLTTMSGHQAPIIDVTIREQYNQVVTQSIDHVIKIWDAQLYMISQTIDCSQLGLMGAYPLTYVTSFPCNKALIVCTHQPSEWCMKQNDPEGQKITTHECPIAGSVYIKCWAQVVTVGIDGEVNVWDVQTGMISLKFLIPINLYSTVVSLGLDGTERRLMTGHQSGALCMWNTANGECLSVVGCGQDPVDFMAYMTDPDGQEAGSTWVGGASEFIYGARDIVPPLPHSRAVEKTSYHKSRITCLTKLNDEFFASGCAHGTINVWTARGSLSCACRMINKHSTHKQTTAQGVLSNIRPGKPREQQNRRNSLNNFAPKLGQMNRRGSVVRRKSSVRRLSSCDDPEDEEDDTDPSVEAILPLINCGHMFVSSHVDGYLRFWEFKQGKMLSAQHAEYDDEDWPFELLCNKKQDRLFCANEEGLVKVWKVDVAALAVGEVESPLTLLSAWRSQVMSSMHGGSYLEVENLLLTIGHDWTAMVWTCEGIKVGIFGQWNPWDLANKETFLEQKPHTTLAFLEQKAISSTPATPATAVLEQKQPESAAAARKHSISSDAIVVSGALTSPQQQQHRNNSSVPTPPESRTGSSTARSRNSWRNSATAADSSEQLKADRPSREKSREVSKSPRGKINLERTRGFGNTVMSATPEELNNALLEEAASNKVPELKLPVLSAQKSDLHKPMNTQRMYQDESRRAVQDETRRAVNSIFESQQGKTVRYMKEIASSRYTSKFCRVIDLAPVHDRRKHHSSQYKGPHGRDSMVGNHRSFNPPQPGKGATGSATARY